MKKIYLNEENKREVIIPAGEQAVIIDVIDKNTGIDQSLNTKILAEENSQVKVITIVHGDVSSELVETRELYAKDGATIDTLYCYFSQANIKSSIHNRIGENSQFNHELIFFGNDKQNFDFKERHQFHKPNGYGKFLTYGFLDGEAQSGYDSMIVIDQYAQKVDSRLDLHSYLLDKNAKSIMVPSLQIEANDVKAGHGATVSFLDEDSLFYMRSRGITEKESVKLFIYGIFDDMIEKIGDEKLGAIIKENLNQKFSIV